MIPADDARQTLELVDRYVILPSYYAGPRDSYVAQGAKPVRENFAYASDSNPERLDARALQQMLGDAFA
jgi:UDP-N-acetylglucosamine 4,6-dehydratase